MAKETKKYSPQIERKIKHAIYRAYLALCRNERYVPTELGDSVPTADEARELFNENTFEVPDQVLRTQLEWTEDEFVRRQVMEITGCTEVEFSRLMIAPKPTLIQNAFFSPVLRDKFASDALNLLPEWGRDDNIMLPQGVNLVIVPVIKDNLIEALEFRPLSMFRK